MLISSQNFDIDAQIRTRFEKLYVQILDTATNLEAVDLSDRISQLALKCNHPQFETTLLIVAVCSRNVPFCKKLLEAGADVDQKGMHKIFKIDGATAFFKASVIRSPLMWSICFLNAEIMQILLSKKPQTSFNDISMACHLKAAKACVEAGQDDLPWKTLYPQNGDLEIQYKNAYELLIKHANKKGSAKPIAYKKKKSSIVERALAANQKSQDATDVEKQTREPREPKRQPKQVVAGLETDDSKACQESRAAMEDERRKYRNELDEKEKKEAALQAQIAQNNRAISLQRQQNRAPRAQNYQPKTSSKKLVKHGVSCHDNAALKVSNSGQQAKTPNQPQKKKSAYQDFIALAALKIERDKKQQVDAQSLERSYQDLLARMRVYKLPEHIDMPPQTPSDIKRDEELADAVTQFQFKGSGKRLRVFEAIAPTT